MKLREISYLYAHLLLTSAQVLRRAMLDLLMTKLTLSVEHGISDVATRHLLAVLPSYKACPECQATRRH